MESEQEMYTTQNISQTFASALSSQTIAFTRAFSFPSEQDENQKNLYKSIFLYFFLFIKIDSCSFVEKMLFSFVNLPSEDHL